MKVADTKEDRLRAHYIEQLNKLGYKDTEGKSLYQLTSALARERFNRIDHDSPKNVWFELWCIKKRSIVVSCQLLTKKKHEYSRLPMPALKIILF